MAHIVRDGLEIHFDDVGSGPPVLLLHAFPLNARMYQSQVDAISNKYRLVLPDIRGFGRSGRGAGPLRMETIAEDALAILDALGIVSAVIGGVSMGGYAALALLRLEPSRVRGLVLMDSQATSDDDAGRQRREESARRLEQEGTSVLLETLLPKLMAPSANETRRAQLAEELIRADALSAAAAQRGMGLRADARELLTRYSGPALFVVGMEDTLTPPAKARQMANLVEGSTLVEIPGAGHLANIEEPHFVNAAITQFLAQCYG